jgi:hypothetical protein
MGVLIGRDPSSCFDLSSSFKKVTPAYLKTSLVVTRLIFEMQKAAITKRVTRIPKNIKMTIIGIHGNWLMTDSLTTSSVVTGISVGLINMVRRILCEACVSLMNTANTLGVSLLDLGNRKLKEKCGFGHFTKISNFPK